MLMKDRAGLRVAEQLVNFVEDRVLPGMTLGSDEFWTGLANIFSHFAPENRALLAKRTELQTRIDAWHDAQAGKPFDRDAYQRHLAMIGYLVPEPAPFSVTTGLVDAELTILAGPQLVVPIDNARFVLNAANARWGSLYDALYGSDAIPGSPTGSGYDPLRGAQVIAWGRRFLDRAVPLRDGSWHDWQGGKPDLSDPAQLIGSAGDNFLLRHHGLHIELVIDRAHNIGRDDPAGLADIVLEAALTAICDLEDSVATVDARDKVAAYANWLGLMKGDLQETFEKNGATVKRTMNGDRLYLAPDGSPFTLPGRSLLFVRNVGHLTTTPAVSLPDGTQAPEGILDGVITALIAIHDLHRQSGFANSRTGSIYIVKPKMHGPEECAFTDRLFDAVEDMLGLARHTIKVGVMDEERRTSANLAACIAAVRHRIMFINTGFLDRTGDEIHTSMRAGPMIRKGEMKASGWIKAYEDRNVQIGLACGLSGKGQIGKGMWAAPDRMAEMLEQKIGHPLSGANTAWVPSPTAAVLHATHYHLVDVFERQKDRRSEAVTGLGALLEIPVARDPGWSRDEIRAELENNAQGILGYVVRWVDQGIGCSKVPDINDVGLMEDRATLRISSQHMANWLYHGVASTDDIDAAFSRMAQKVDRQNASDPLYRPMSGKEAESLSYHAAQDLVFKGTQQPSGYTEPLLHTYRARVKAQITATIGSPS